MAKRKTKKSNKQLIFLATILGLVAVCMIFFPAFQYGETSFTGLQSAFGYTEKSDGIIFVSAKILEINLLTLVAYLLPLGGIVVALLSKKSNMLTIISAVLFIVAGACGFLSVTTFSGSIIGSNLVSLNWQLAYGIIISAICSLLAGLIMIVKIFFKK